MRDKPIETPQTEGPAMTQNEVGTYVPQNEEKVYENADWSDPNASDYVEAA